MRCEPGFRAHWLCHLWKDTELYRDSVPSCDVGNKKQILLEGESEMDVEGTKDLSSTYYYLVSST